MINKLFWALVVSICGSGAGFAQFNPIPFKPRPILRRYVSPVRLDAAHFRKYFSKEAATRGEKYPETRLKQLSLMDVQDWSPDEVQYALNEICARHGYAFKNRSIAKQFKFVGAYVSTGRRDMEQFLRGVERQNYIYLYNRRDWFKKHPIQKREQV